MYVELCKSWFSMIIKNKNCFDHFIHQLLFLIPHKSHPTNTNQQELKTEIAIALTKINFFYK